MFGRGYLRKWKAAKKDVCVSGSSTFTCYDHPPKDHGTNVGSLFCTATNLVLDSADFLGDVMKGQRYPNPKKGSARVACQIANPLPWARPQLEDQHTERWLYDALTSAPASEVDAACADPARSVPYPVYFVTRMDPTNAFHHFEEVVNFFASIAIFPHKELLQQGIAVVAFDGAVPGYFLELWRRIAYPYRIRFLRARPYPPGTCFKHVLLASMPHRTLYTHFWPGRDTHCRSLVFTGLMAWAHALMGDVRPEVYTWPDGQHRQNDATVVGRVTWVSRRRFEAANRDKFSGWQSQRILNNEDAIVRALDEAVREWNAGSCLHDPGRSGCRSTPVVFEFGSTELGDLRWYPEQLSVLSRTNVLMAIHGAGVFNEVWMRPSVSAVIEVLHNSGGQYHYHNIAAFLGLPYHSMPIADPQALATKLKAVMDETAPKMAAEAAGRRAAAAGTDSLSATSAGFAVTERPEEACLLVPTIDAACAINSCTADNLTAIEQHLRALPYWNNGANHVIWFYGSDWPSTGYDVGDAIVISASFTDETYRPAYDVAVPLTKPSLVEPPPGLVRLGAHIRRRRSSGAGGGGGGRDNAGPDQRASHDDSLEAMLLQGVAATRDLLLYFRGTVPAMASDLCSHRFRIFGRYFPPAVHNAPDVVIQPLCAGVHLYRKADQPQLEHCRNCVNNQRLTENVLGGSCTDAWQDNITFAAGLTRARFAFAPRGCGPLSYRLMEGLMYGAVPVQTGYGSFVPYAGEGRLGRLWDSCVLYIREEDLGGLVARLRGMDRREYARRLASCLELVALHSRSLFVVARQAVCVIASRVASAALAPAGPGQRPGAGSDMQAVWGSDAGLLSACRAAGVLRDNL
ncbi:hypothetical protein GPECTOR_51g714 [Gonium pectorale]|uniref:Exostosin GT47 domain-containing protein n=1 Tax=Gonium pectorale TaxID=33097 RepID=A0A150G7C3_GONPE|nr:hypothetical protein GPECTOR_51g714 [Gonium pectorale]|eukprot:KXZ45728.1 hypothetical protein GPECTOR_51g714 [Gonium pectorale]